ncbi:MAG: rod shape-determining protein MreD [Muribaculaceae bacterium]|nr:rod shape-determining protein MreD [Muribaculaceae bacterium]
MTKEILKYLLLFIVLVVAQVVVFNHLCLFNVAVPLVFIYFIIKLPVTLSVNWAMTFSFILGLMVDIFSNTQGMNALACTVLAVMRLPLLRLYFPREEDMTNPEPSLHTLGPAAYMKYLLTTVAFYCAIFFLIESFTFYNWGLMVLRIVSSTLLTFIIILSFDSLTAKSR